MQWDQEPNTWDLVAQIGLELWTFAALAMVVGFAAARKILVPEGASVERSRAKGLALWRTLIGFGFVAALSLPYRSLDESVDKVLGNFNISVLVALAVCAISAAAFWLNLGVESREGFRAGLGSAAARLATFLGTLVLCWLVPYWILGKTTGPEWAELGLVPLPLS